MGVKVETFVDNSAPSCGAKHLNGTKNEINNAIEALNITLDEDDDSQLATGLLNMEKSIEIASSNIDWSLGKTFKKHTSGSPTFTFSNITEKRIRVFITDTDSGTVTWPTYILWDNSAAAPTQTVLKTDIYEFQMIDGSIVGKRIYLNIQGDWPYGAMGDLHVTSSNTPYQLPAGQVYDFNDVTIDDGCVLEFTGDTVDFTILGIAGDLSGPVSGMGYIYCKGSSVVGTGACTTPDGIVLSKTIVQSNSGNGGNGGNNVTSSGGSGGSGNAQGGGGGGGGGGSEYNNAGAGGNGGYNGANAIGGYAGIGGSVDNTTNGGNGGITPYAVSGGVGGNGAGGGGGGASGDTLSGEAPGGGGGGGGTKGLHGKNLYIRCKGTVTGTYLTINVSGTNGVNGGTGGNTGSVGSPSAGGGGGGGGAGGSGGNVIFYYTTGTYTAPTFVLTAGTGGTGGIGGSGYNNGSNGTNGTAGTIGTKTEVAV